MKSHRPLHALTLLLTCAAGLGLAPVARGLLSPSPAERAQFVRGVVEMTDDAVAEALRVLERDESSPRDVWSAYHAVQTLGALRAEVAVDALMRHLDFRCPLLTRTEIRRWHAGDYYPALQALVEIGPASSTRIVREFRRISELSPTERGKLFWVLYQIEGRHPGCFLIEQELASLEPGPNSAQVRAELSQALAQFEAYDLYLEHSSPVCAF
jgi:hypothetical protein